MLKRWKDSSRSLFIVRAIYLEANYPRLFATWLFFFQRKSTRTRRNEIKTKRERWDISSANVKVRCNRSCVSRVMKRNCIKLRCLSLTRSLVQLFRACRLSFFYYSSSPRYRAVVTAGGRIKIRLHSGWRRKEKRKKLSENYPPRVTLARCRLEIYATRRLILSIESFGRFENRPVKSRSLRASFLPTATREGDFSRVSRRVESLRRQNDPMSSARQTADAFARFKSPDRSISPAMHYSPECFISPFLNRLSAPTWRDAKPFHPAYYRSPLSQVRITCPDILLFEQKGQRPSSYSVDTLRNEKV